MKFTINLVTPDNGEKFVVEMSNSTLTNIKGQQAKNPNLTITINRADLETVMGGKATFDELIAAGKAKFDGDRKPFDQLTEHAGPVHAGLRADARHQAREGAGTNHGEGPIRGGAGRYQRHSLGACRQGVLMGLRFQQFVRKEA